MNDKSIYQCPKCGWWPSHGESAPDSTPDPNLIEQTKPKVDATTSKEFAVNAYYWHETWKCAKCGTIWTFENGNC